MLIKYLRTYLHPLFGSFLILSGIFSMLASQTPNIREGAEKKPETTAAVAGLNTYSPISIQDPRFSVKNLNFVRRYDSTGQGEFLDVIMDIYNHTAKTLDLKVFVFAFYETDAQINKGDFNLAPAPEWRSFDPSKTTFLTHYMTITPRDFKEEEIWNENDPDYWKYRKTAERIRNHVTTLEPISEFLPPYWKYLSYIASKPEEGLSLKLYGEETVKPEETIYTNYIAPTPEEVMRKMNKNEALHKYTAYYDRRHTLFQSHHYSKFRPSYVFFNRVAIIIYDASKIEAAKAQQGKELKPGEEKIDPLVYKKTLKMSKNLKVY